MATKFYLMGIDAVADQPHFVIVIICLLYNVAGEKVSGLFLDTHNTLFIVQSYIGHKIGFRDYTNTHRVVAHNDFRILIRV